MKDLITLITLVLVALLIIVLPIWWTVYKFKDCRNVGHSLTYCIFDIGS